MSFVRDGVSYKAADAHAHIYPEKIAEKATANVGIFYNLNMENVGRSEDLLKMGSENGMDKYLISSVATKIEQVRSISTFIAGECSKHPEFVGLGAWHQDVEDIKGEFDFIEKMGLKGIKLHPDFQKFNIDDPKMMPVYKEAEKRKLVVLFHMGDYRTDFSTPERLMNVLKEVPDLICIAAHLGGYTAWDEAYGKLKGKNLYVDSCSSLALMPKEDAVRNIKYFGTDKVLFGTDFPMWSHDSELERFFGLGFSVEENKKMLYENFCKLYNVE